MGEHDNAGFPLSYCMLSTATSIEIGKRKTALGRWVTALRDTYSIMPRFAHTDKDMGEIGMLRDVWDSKIQLCWWHLKKAVRERLGKGKLSTTPYHALIAKQEFTFIDTAFAPAARADPTEHEGGIRDMAGIGDGQLGVVSSALRDQSNMARQASMSARSTPTSTHLIIKLPPPGRENIPVARSSQAASIPTHVKRPSSLGKEKRVGDVPNNQTTDGATHMFCPTEFREGIINMMEKHLCAHPSIPGRCHPSAEGIREWAVRQMYQFCVSHDLCEVWAYLWENWYRRGRWELWARSVHAEISRLKTTMIMESQ